MPNIEPVALQAQSTLRRRMHVLENAHKTSSEQEPRRRNPTEETVLSHTDYESASASEDSSDEQPAQDEDIPEIEGNSDDESDGAQEDEQYRPALQDRTNSGSRSSVPSYSLPRDRSWYEFDLTVVAALVSPIGNWLTGGDHVKNVILVLLLLFYLHQIIEVPWSLYHKARPRDRPPHIRSSYTSAEEQFRGLASSELRRIELFLLTVTVFSPFIGAYLIQLVSTAVLGKDAFSWFSISLFVLATGVRPWSHVAQRIAGRVSDLHDIVHYPAHHPTSNSDFRTELEELRKQFRQLDASMTQLHRKSAVSTQEMYDYVDDALDVVEKAMKRQEKKSEKQEGQYKELETTVLVMKKSNRPKPPPVLLVNDPPRTPSLLEQLWSLLCYLFPFLFRPYAVSRKNASPNEGRTSPSSTVTRYSVQSPSSPDGLETIVEESGPPEPGVDYLNLPAKLFLRFAYFATFPLRSVSRMVSGHS
ncbi:hypothetical protein V5O48_012089 [Marasmius crinis-equi]|uniref:Uncharacterized protein n=1 Tax=Marasmius crinis-equi TaxID=585013 RepID=A0ABR3F4C5_9AGAR